MSQSRRDFLKRSALATAGTMLIPSFLSAFQQGQHLQASNGKKLVVIQLAGGNDGLNTVVPYQNDIYYRSRPNLAIAKNEVLRLNDDLGLNPALTGLKSLYDDGLCMLINSVGYPNPDRSHFRSMDIWHTGSNANEYWQSGWVGRLLDAQCQQHCEQAHLAIEVDDTLGLALKGEQIKGLATQDPKKLYRATQDKGLRYLVNKYPELVDEHDHEVTYLYKTMAETFASADYVYEKSKVYRSSQTYPQNKLGRNLKTIAELIISGSDTKVYYVSFSGFDTHANQKNQQSRLLKNYSEAVTAFVKDLKKNGFLDDTLIMTFSEFGRRVAQNASNGTDHGTANNLFLMGGKLKKAGVFNQAPDLKDLDNGDLKFQVDFRKVYATILENWMDVNASNVLNRNFEKLTIV